MDKNFELELNKMLGQMDEARQLSKKADNAVYAMSNGKEITIVTSPSLVESMKDSGGCWIAAIYEKGQKVEC